MSEVKNQIEMEAPPDDVFKVVSDLNAWPRYLPHYRWIRVMESHPDHQIVRMACYRGWLPIDWVSRFELKPALREIHFIHLRALTYGMRVVWRFEPLRDGVATRAVITHDLEPVIQKRGRFIAEKIIGGYFIDYIANRTLKSFAMHFAQKDKKRG